MPRVEITGRLAGLVATYDDGRGADPDADDTHLMLHAGRCSFVANVFGESVRCKVTFKTLQKNKTQGCRFFIMLCLHRHLLVK